MNKQRTITFEDYGLPTIENEKQELGQLREFYKIIIDCAANEQLVEELDNGTFELQGGNEVGVRIDLELTCLMLADYYERNQVFDDRNE